MSNIPSFHGLPGLGVMTIKADALPVIQSVSALSSGLDHVARILAPVVDKLGTDEEVPGQSLEASLAMDAFVAQHLCNVLHGVARLMGEYGPGDSTPNDFVGRMARMGEYAAEGFEAHLEHSHAGQDFCNNDGTACRDVAEMLRLRTSIITRLAAFFEESFNDFARLEIVQEVINRAAENADDRAKPQDTPDDH